ncbi:MAG TPA: division/cell wall cluster transcriptional repressor MraZ [Polyangiaceae bacterium]|nr:division/cell wall cluster transcriptional repressor MraZ [Polyangiaceae bacterium]
MFRGQFVHTIDAKGRVSLPARFRESIVANGDARLVLTPAPFDPCLHLYPLSDWAELEKKIDNLSRFEPDIVRFRRMYVSAALECELDGGGRVLVSPDYRARAHLGKEVLVAGMGRVIELWSKDLWDRATAPLPAEEQERFMRRVEELIRI